MRFASIHREMGYLSFIYASKLIAQVDAFVNRRHLRSSLIQKILFSRRQQQIIFLIDILWRLEDVHVFQNI